MIYCKSYCEANGISTSQLNEAQKTLHYVAENMKMDKSISEEGYKHFQQAIESLKAQPCEDVVSREAVLNTLDAMNTVLDENRTVDSYKELLTECYKTLPFVNPKQRWIPVSERMPEEHEWIGTKTFGTTISNEVYVTFESPKGERFTKHLSFQNGKVSNFVQREIDALYKGSVPIAWMPLPKPYKAESEDKE